MATVSFSVNLKNGGISQYNGFDFSSLCNWNGRVFGTKHGVGLCEIGEQYKTDNGAKIYASFATLPSDLGYQGPKALRSIVAQYRADSKLILTYTADEKRSRSKTIYPFNTPMEPQARQINAARDIRGTVFSFSVSNMGSAADFTVYALNITPVLLNIGSARVK